MVAEDDLQAALQHHGAGRLEAAEALYRQVLAARPDDPRALLLFGRLLLARGNATEAIVWLERAVPLLPALGQSHAALADALYAAGRTMDAIERYRWALAIDPAIPAVWHGLGRALAVRGQTGEAIASLRRAVTLEPGLLAAHRDLAGAGCTDGAEQLERLLRRPDLPHEQRVEAGFALASLLDRAGDYDRAFALFAASNALARRRLADHGQRFDLAALRATIDARQRLYTPAFFAAGAGWGVPDERPVFVVGMPRSGTTLVEQILASHPAAAGVGEGNHVGALSAAADAAAHAGHWDRATSRRLAAGHLQRLASLAPGAARVVDKTPDNVFHLGLIAVLFPAARIVLCRRDPRDICLSCFCQGFAEPIAYATDLADCAQRLQEVDRLVAHWQAVLPLPIHTVQYEALVANLEAEAGRLVGFLGLDWDPACLAFHRQGHEVRSASLWQVRQPVHTGSVGRWRHYRTHLGPLLDAFGRD